MSNKGLKPKCKYCGASLTVDELHFLQDNCSKCEANTSQYYDTEEVEGGSEDLFKAVISGLCANPNVINHVTSNDPEYQRDIVRAAVAIAKLSITQEDLDITSLMDSTANGSKS